MFHNVQSQGLDFRINISAWSEKLLTLNTNVNQQPLFQSVISDLLKIQILCALNLKHLNKAKIYQALQLHFVVNKLMYTIFT